MSLETSNTASELLNSPDTNLEEDQILELLSKLRLEIYQIESTTGPSKRTSCMRNEIKRLENQLAYCKDQDTERPDQESQDISWIYIDHDSHITSLFQLPGFPISR